MKPRAPGGTHIMDKRNDHSSIQTLPMRPPTTIHDDILCLTVLLLLFYGGSSWLLDVPLKIACGAALLLPRVRTGVPWWIGTVSLVVLINGMSWHSIDNHKYLIAYWAIAVTTAAAWPDRARDVLSWNARGLVATCFAFAVIWKLLAGQYLDGSFWHYTLLTDPRVQVAASALGGVPLSDLGMNQRLTAAVAAWPTEGPVVHLVSSDRIAAVALVASGWALLFESSIAVLWVLPGRAARWKDAALIGFILTTYTILPVVGFATVLGVLGYAAASCAGRTRLANVYLAVIGVVQLVSVPWSGYLSHLLAPVGETIR